MEILNQAQTYQEPFTSKVRKWFFPYKFDFDEIAEFQELPDGSCKPGTTAFVGFHFSFADRLRLMFGGRLETRVIVNCDHDPGKTEARTFIQIL